MEKNGLNSVTRSLMTLKLAEICKSAPIAGSTDSAAIRKYNDVKYRLWSYAENKLVTVCQGFDSKQDVAANIEIV